MEIDIPFEDLLEKAILLVPRLIAALVLFALALLLAGFIARWILRVMKKRGGDPETACLLARLGRWSVIVVGAIVALEQVDFDLTSFVAGLGIAGLTVGFALQDIARNFVAGIILLIRQPFNIGDAVEVADHAGSVLDLTVRDTVIKTWDGVQVVIPNIDVFSNPITNYSALNTRRRTVNIGLGYGEDVDRACQVFLETIRGVEGVAEDPPPEVLVEDLGASTLDMAARFWVDQTEHGLFDVHSRVVQAIKEVAEREGIDLPYPIQTMRLEKV